MFTKKMSALWLAIALLLAACSTQTIEKPETTEVVTEVTVTESAQTEPATESAAGDSSTAPADETAYPITVTDGLGQSVTLQKEPEKIVALAPNVTEVLFALGLGDKIVAASEFSDYPAEAASIETVGGASGFDMERIVELEPDLVITNGMVQGLPEAMSGADIASAGYYPQSLDQVIEQIRQIAELTNTKAQGEAIIKDMNARKDAVVASVQGLPQPTVFYEVWGDPLMVAGKGSFINEMITLVGAKDIAGDSEPYSNYDLEQLIANDPEIYLINDGDPSLTKETVAARPGYADLKAVKEGKVLSIHADLISRPGPRLIDGLEELADLLQPDRAK